MNRTCTRAHDGKYPEEAILAFCTQVDCNKRFVCGRCYHDYHSDHLIQIVPIRELQVYINEANGQTQVTLNLMDQLQVIKKQLIQTIESLCTDLQKQGINQGNNITEEMLDKILEKNQNSETRLKKVKEVLSDFQNIDNALKQNIRIQRQVSIVKDRVFNGVTYSGEVVKDMRHGIGTAVYNSGSYHGLWNEGERCGQGIFKAINGDQYEGEWKEDKRHGRGVYKYANGNSYDGEWKEDKKHGRGVYKWADGNSYDGEWKEGNQHGRGVYKWANGNSYQGEYKEDKIHGRGVFKQANGNSYDGEWKEGNQHGRGVFKWGIGSEYNGDIYDGEFKGDKKHGRGVYKWANGNQYDGDWLNDKRTGSGKFIYQNGNIKIGKWNESQQQGNHEFYELKKTSIITYKGGKEIKRQQI